MYRYLAIGIACLLIGFASGWKTQDWRLSTEIAKIRANHQQTLDKLEARTLQAEQNFRERERSYIISLTDAQEKRNEEVAAINRRHTAVIAGLRNRPERIAAIYCPGSEVPVAPTACIGTTGQELARGDAEFLAGYAADAAKLDAALTQCEAAYNAIRSKVD